MVEDPFDGEEQSLKRDEQAHVEPASQPELKTYSDTYSKGYIFLGALTSLVLTGLSWVAPLALLPIGLLFVAAGLYATFYGDQYLMEHNDLWFGAGFLLTAVGQLVLTLV